MERTDMPVTIYTINFSFKSVNRSIKHPLIKNTQPNIRDNNGIVFSILGR